MSKKDANNTPFQPNNSKDSHKEGLTFKVVLEFYVKRIEVDFSYN